MATTAHQAAATGGATGASAIAGLLLPNADPKSQLVTFCQRFYQRQTTKDDITYTSVKCGEVYQATVTIRCLEGQQFVGETAGTPKDAEKSAAIQALIYFRPLFDHLPPSTNPNQHKKRKAPSAGVDEDPLMKAMKAMKAAAAAGAPPVSSADQSITSKVLLNNLCMKLLRRPLARGDVAFQAHWTPLGHQSTVTLPCLPGEWGGLAWAGEMATTLKQSEQNAAYVAVNAVNASIDAIKALLAPLLLNNLCTKLLRRPLAKGDMAFETHPTPLGGNQSTVKLPCLPGEWGGLAWAGEVAATPKQSEQNAACVALDAVNASIDAIEALLPPQEEKEEGKAAKTAGSGGAEGGNGTLLQPEESAADDVAANRFELAQKIQQ